MWACMAHFASFWCEASDWLLGCHGNGKPRTIRIVGSSGSHMTGNDVTRTGSEWQCGGHVIWRGRPLTSGKKDRGLRWRKERTCHAVDMTYPLARVENPWPVGKRDRGLRVGKTTEERGLKVQSPIFASGEVNSEDNVVSDPMEEVQASNIRVWWQEGDEEGMS